MTLDIRQKVLDGCSYGLYIVTSHNGEGKINGQLSDALMQITAFPPKVAVSINKSELTHEYITKSGVFAATIISRKADMKFIGLFGFKSGREIDKLSQAEYKKGTTALRLLLKTLSQSSRQASLRQLTLAHTQCFLLMLLVPKRFPLKKKSLPTDTIPII